MSPLPSLHITILGAGAMGKAIAKHLSLKTKQIYFYGNKKNNGNTTLYPVTNDVNQALSKADYVFVCLPSGAVEEKLNEITKEFRNNFKGVIVLCNKGLSFKYEKQNSPDYFFSNIVQNLFPNAEIAIFSGPTFASEMEEMVPTIASLAMKQKNDQLFELLQNDNLVLKHTKDVYNTQIIGAFKNVIAIKIGLLEEMAILIHRNFTSSKSYFNRITKTYLEMIEENLSLLEGSAPHLTLLEPAGLGDIILTSAFDKSRNKQFGRKVGSILFEKLMNKFNRDINKVEECFLKGQIDPTIVSSEEVKTIQTEFGKLTEGIIALKPLHYLSRQVNTNSDSHLEWLYQMFYQ